MNNPFPQLFYGTAWKEERTETLVDQAIRLGVRAIDSANQRRHYFEAATGRAVANHIQQGTVLRSELFLQSKFTYQQGQDHRLPYNPQASLADQVRQSFASSLEHFQTDYLDSLLLHGPLYRQGISAQDWQVWTALGELQSRGQVRHVGLSNVSAGQLQEWIEKTDVPITFVQNRCFAALGWDREVRQLCRQNGILYQGFSLLTANIREIESPRMLLLAERYKTDLASLVFAFAHAVGMIVLTGTTQADHLMADLKALNLVLSAEDVKSIETIAFSR
ncbi:MAG: aldo/keto reductase [Acidobacteria bacterium]|nr:aldo/keto reductase [Acidobacteriota bacterium]MCB9399167.1 aldo/keto reductase [Acidobacteriota bacterium]